CKSPGFSTLAPKFLKPDPPPRCCRHTKRSPAGVTAPPAAALDGKTPVRLPAGLGPGAQACPAVQRVLLPRASLYQSPSSAKRFKLSRSVNGHICLALISNPGRGAHGVKRPTSRLKMRTAAAHNLTYISRGNK